MQRAGQAKLELQFDMETEAGKIGPVEKVGAPRRVWAVSAPAWTPWLRMTVNMASAESTVLSSACSLMGLSSHAD